MVLPWPLCLRFPSHPCTLPSAPNPLAPLSLGFTHAPHTKLPATILLTPHGPRAVLSTLVRQTWASTYTDYPSQSNIPYYLLTQSQEQKKKGASIVIVVVVTIRLTLGSKLFPHIVPLYEILSDAATAPSFAPSPSCCIYPHLGIDISILVLATPKPLCVSGSSTTRSSSMSKPIPIPTCRSLPVQHSLTTQCAWACAGHVHTRTWSTARTCAALFTTLVN